MTREILSISTSKSRGSATLRLTTEILIAQRDAGRRTCNCISISIFLDRLSDAAHGRRMRNPASKPSQPTAVVNPTVTGPAYTSSPTSGAAPSAAIDPTYTRLHITPLDSNLLKTIVPSAVLPSIRGLSYHTIQTFPDKPYGFVELPSADALKIKNKLNGAVLRGAKIRIEPARPVKMPIPSEDAILRDVGAIEAREKSNKAKKDKKRKRDALEVAGVELDEGRKVRRGWTVTPEEAISKKKKEKQRSKGKDKDKGKDKEDSRSSSKKEKRKKRELESLYTENAECLVKTLLPPNKRDLVDNESGKARKRAKKGQHQAVLVHEFERNTKFATFLKTTKELAPEQAATTFVEGQGWVDEDGAVVEDVKLTRPTAFPKMQVEQPNRSPEPVLGEDTSSSSDDTSLEDESEIELDMLSNKRSEPVLRHSSPGKEKKGVSSDLARPKSSSSARSLTINIPPATPSAGAVHPLEALYKRHKQDETGADKTANTSEPFTFGGIGDDLGDDDDMSGPGEAGVDVAGDHKSPYGKQSTQPPMTPFTKQDLEWRNVRSAAPTPDTAHPSRISRLWFPGQGDDALGDLEEDNEDDSGSEEAPSAHRFNDDQSHEDSANNAPADFQKLFWERRAELNRSWKKRRRMSAKEKRYRDNKAMADRAI